jgi:sirohydrochlorin ferrochelatase
MKFLLLVAHGSRREVSNDEIRILAKRLQAMNHPFAEIGCAFLEIGQPSIQEALHRLIADGAKEIVVLPYFLSAGRHVATDIPEQIKQVKNQYPNVQIGIATYLGASEMIAELVMKQALEKLSAI